MKPHVYRITGEDVGRLGVTRRDVGKWCVLVQGCPHIRKTEAEARALARCLEN